MILPNKFLKQEIYFLLDVETTMDRSVFDYAFVICNSTKILFKYNALVKEVYTDKDRMIGAYYANKLFSEYPELMMKGLQLKTLSEIKEDTAKAINHFNPKYITAYNLAFDSDALGKTSERLLGETFIDTAMEYFCLWGAACETLCLMPSFETFCKKNGFITSKGNLKTDAETVFRFIKKDSSFIEDHTALSDCENVEAPILFKILKKGGFNTNTIIASPWKLNKSRI